MQSTQLNYVMVYTENIRDLVADKLTIITNKANLQCKVKLILCVAQSFDVNSTNKYREIYDEMSICRFSPESVKFWNLRNLYRILYYCYSADIDEQIKSIFIDQCTVVHGLPVLTCDFAYKNIYSSPIINDTYLYVLDLLKGANEYKPEDDFVCYDFSCCYMSNELKRLCYMLLSEVLSLPELSQRYMSLAEVNVLMSILLRRIFKNKEVLQLNMNIPDLKISESLISSMYLML